MTEPILDVRDLKVHFQVPDPNRLFGTSILKAVDGVSLKLQPGETLGVVGESGCGKSTLARGILRLVPITSGKVLLLNRDLNAMDKRQLREQRRDLQVIFQDPLASLNPRMTVGDIIAEPLRTFEKQVAKKEQQERVQAMLETVGLQATHINRYPHEFSGGQCQRIGIARALILKPKLVVCDEPVSALDVSIQAQIVNLLMDLQAEHNLSLIFIAHDLNVVRQISHRVMVMYLGRVVEVADRDVLYANPRHPYTRALIAAVPVPDPRLEKKKRGSPLKGDLPSPMNPPSGCAFRTRCPFADSVCEETTPQLEVLDQSLVACHHAEQILETPHKMR